MARLSPVAFDIETTGFDPDAAVTVAGLRSDRRAWLGLHTAGRAADPDRLGRQLGVDAEVEVEVDVRHEEAGLLDALGRVASDRLDGDRHYLCAFNGETWRGGFDLPFLRTACARRGVDWPFPPMAYADVRSMVRRFNTGDVGDLAGTAHVLLGAVVDDPFEDSVVALSAFERADWAALLAHNLADLARTYDLAVLAGRYVPKSDYRMKNLAPPG